MKKVLMLQLHNKSFGGIFQVHKAIGEELIKNNVDCRILCLREFKVDYDNDTNIKIDVIDNKSDWIGYGYSDAIKSFSINRVIKRFKQGIKLVNDKKFLNDYINDYEPDLILVSNYVFLDLIDSNYYNKVYYQQHSSFIQAFSNKGNKEALIKYKDKIKYIFLCNNTLEKAKEFFLLNSISIYNPVRYKCNDICNYDSKRLVCISRISSEKRIDLMVKLVNEVLSESKYKDWLLDIYGDGGDFNKVENFIKLNNISNIRLMGVTNDPKSVYLDSCINLSTSMLEGFPMSILESNECGVPSLVMDFGESCSEVVINNKTGFIVDNEDEFKDKLRYLMDNLDLVRELGNNCKEYNKRFYIDNVIKEWLKLVK